MKRSDLLRQIGHRLGNRRLIWFGTRGDDVESAAQIPNLETAFSVISAYRGRSKVTSLALEDLTGIRVDLDTFDIDHDEHVEELLELRRALMRSLSHPSALFTYRPSAFVSAACFARRDRCRYLGLFNDHQAAFEHKPWLETAIAELGLPQIPWTYVADEDQIETLRFLDDGPVMLRRSRTTGGVGLVKVEDSTELEALWPREEAAFVSVAPYLDDSISLNASGVVWHDGVTVHPASVQLVGVPELTTRPFGYCGNDFGALRALGDHLIEQVDDAVRRIGWWLGRYGYRGAFGVDFLVVDGVPLFTEVNPRFQGSTHASCRLSVEIGESCLLLEHLAAFLDIDAPAAVPLNEQLDATQDLAHFIVHWTGDEPVSLDPGALAASLTGVTTSARMDVATHPAVTTEPGATVIRCTTRSQVTSDGRALHAPWGELIDSWHRSLGLRAKDTTKSATSSIL